MTTFTASYEEAGAPAGRYKVTVFTVAAPEITDSTVSEELPSNDYVPEALMQKRRKKENGSGNAVFLTPVVYQNLETTPLSFSVTKEGGVFDIELIGE